MRKATLLLVSSVLMGLVLSGCGGDGVSSVQVTDEERIASTPEEAIKASLRARAKAVETGDARQFVARMDVPEQASEFMVAAMEFGVALNKFIKNAVEAYGDDIAGKLGHSAPQDSLIDGSNDFLENIDAAKIEVDGDTAVVTHPDEDKPLPMVKRDGIWKTAIPQEDAAQMEKMPKELIEAMVTGMEGALEAINEMEPQIGKLSEDEFVKEYKETEKNNPKMKKMGEAMGAMMMEAMKQGMQQE